MPRRTKSQSQKGVKSKAAKSLEERMAIETEQVGDEARVVK